MTPLRAWLRLKRTVDLSGGKPWFSPVERKWKRRFGRVTVRYERRSPDGFMGRFGGGWNRKIGVMIGGQTWHFDLWSFSLSFSTYKPKPYVYRFTPYVPPAADAPPPF